MKKNKEEHNKMILTLIVVLVIIFVILTLGAFVSTDEEKKIKLEDEQVRKRNRLKVVQKRINELLPKREELNRKEKRFFLWSRIVIATILVFFNFLYWKFVIQNDEVFFDLGEQLNFIGAITILYSFAAFISYGSLDKFVFAMKTKISKQLKKKHVDMLMELELLENERDNILKELKKLDESIKIINNENT